MISFCCSAVLRSGDEGQSMLPTVATHAARSSRGAGGGSSGERAGLSLSGNAGSGSSDDDVELEQLAITRMARSEKNRPKRMHRMQNQSRLDVSRVKCSRRSPL